MGLYSLNAIISFEALGGKLGEKIWSRTLGEKYDPGHIGGWACKVGLKNMVPDIFPWGGCPGAPCKVCLFWLRVLSPSGELAVSGGKQLAILFPAHGRVDRHDHEQET